MTSVLPRPSGVDHSFAHLPTTFACGGCGYRLPAASPVPLSCPAAAPGDDVDHVLRRTIDTTALDFPVSDDPNPFVRYRTLFHGYHVARAIGWSDGDFVLFVRNLDQRVEAVDGRGFTVTPHLRVEGLARRLGLIAPVLVKDETGGVAGSHKARHLMGTAIEIEMGEALERARAATGGLHGGSVLPARLAIASCGNAALAAAVVARAWGRPLSVFVPAGADEIVLARIRDLDASVSVERRVAGAPGDPALRALRRALAGGAIAFTCQGTDNCLALEGGLTLGYELAEDVAQAHTRLDRLFIQVGGGALASSVAQALEEAVAFGVVDRMPRIHAVQSSASRPLARAYQRVVARLARLFDGGLREATAAAARPDATPWERRTVADALRLIVGTPRGAAELARAAHHRSAYMWPWEEEPRSVATGILDDETYDWFAVVTAMLRTGGYPVAASEADLREANVLGRETTGIDVDHTGTAGLAGLIALRRSGEVAPDESVAVLFTGARRAVPPAPSTPRSTTAGDRT